MNFKYKCALQSAFSALPRGERLNYLFQRHITKTLPFRTEKFIDKATESYRHFQKFQAHNRITHADNSYYEFGAGWDLINPIAMNLLGFKKLTVIDIRRLIYPELIADTITKFNSNRNRIPFSFRDLSNIRLTPKNCLSILKEEFGISYVAPCDAQNTGLAENSIDFIASNVTFEHIPAKDILPILQESYRILKPGGVFSAVIDYQDHWSYFDKTLTVYNYLRYSSDEWRKFNPSLHYQNRLRHKDYIAAMLEPGFEIVEEIPTEVAPQDRAALQTVPVHAEFSRYTPDELLIRSAHIVLRKK